MASELVDAELGTATVGGAAAWRGRSSVVELEGSGVGLGAEVRVMVAVKLDGERGRGVGFKWRERK